jgi:hypothetical protein
MHEGLDRAHTIATVTPESSALSPSGPGCRRSTVSTAKKTPEMGALKPAATPASYQGTWCSLD